MAVTEVVDKNTRYRMSTRNLSFAAISLWRPRTAAWIMFRNRFQGEKALRPGGAHTLNNGRCGGEEMRYKLKTYLSPRISTAASSRAGLHGRRVRARSQPFGKSAAVS
ncbi:hypothetical protein EVAR_95975_1 [Eumeta japonica]|uniref:Uncharacterized protein n=1 Tax=Eumeta variegata TaxID=151549 RepID=A0A4C1V8I5_EUMVA|nr:hypothetical protein EVAR_95975_1 [Eumeta japonica]